MIYYVDTSALIKRYVTEAGGRWIVDLCDPVAGNLITTAMITKAEAAAALASKLRNGGLSPSDYASVLQDLNHDFLQEYALVKIDRVLIDLAVALTARQRLRGYDAVQLAAAITLNTVVM